MQSGGIFTAAAIVVVVVVVGGGSSGTIQRSDRGAYAQVMSYADVSRIFSYSFAKLCLKGLGAFNVVVPLTFVGVDEQIFVT